MEKQELLDKTRETLTPFETEHIVNFIRNLSVKSAMEHPLFFIIIFAFIVFGIVKRSKFVLLFLFAAISVMFLVRYSMPVEGDQLDVKSTLPFTFGGLAIGAALIYFTFIKSD
jgi:hypothetical protein